MPTRFDRWMRSKLSAMTARTPSSFGPLAAQSRERAGAVFLAGQNDQRHTALRVFHAGVEDGHLLALGQQWRVTPPSVPGASLFRSRTLANVPRTITS